MKSIDKLREWLDYKINRFDVGENALMLNTGANPNELYDFADEIEAEISDNYMRLPLDADNVTIHVGDICEMNGERFKVQQLCTDGNCWWAVGLAGEFYIADLCRHAKPRTLEDVLIEYRLKAYNLYADQELTGDERVDEFKKLDAEYDSGIRELLGGDAE